MSGSSPRPPNVPESLAGLRRRLTAWYVGTLLLILALLGGGLFATITRRFDSDLDASLRDASGLLATTAQHPDGLAASRALIIPGRSLIIFDSAGNAVQPSTAEPWLEQFARDAVHGGGRSTSHESGDRIMRAYAQPFTASDNRPYLAVSVADEIEVEDKYTSLIAVTVAAAVVALILVAIGGWIVAGKSTEPVERSMTLMRQFMADAAHELRTPVTVVRSRAEVALQRPREPAEYQAALQAIERESVRVGRIIEQLLTLARADAGERPIERERVFLDDIMLDAAEAARALAVSSGRHVRVEVDEFEEAPVFGDSVLLRQLVLILLDNAVKFSKESGCVRVGVRTTGGVPSLSVADDGIGISAEQLPHIFDRFYRGDVARTRGAPGSSEGAGLGLSIARWIADEHRASIKVDSSPSTGTRVVVEFPDSGLVSSS